MQKEELEETIDDKIDMIWSRAHIPEYADDAKIVIKSFIRSLLQEKRDEMVNAITTEKEVYEQGYDDESKAFVQAFSEAISIINKVMK